MDEIRPPLFPLSMWHRFGPGRVRPIRLLPGIADQVVINSAITLPIGVEAYAAYAMWAWLAPPSAGVSPTAGRFACWSALGAGASPRLEF